MHSFEKSVINKDIPADTLFYLPVEILVFILSFLKPKDYLKLAPVCKFFAKYSQEQREKRDFYLPTLNFDVGKYSELEGWKVNQPLQPHGVIICTTPEKAIACANLISQQYVSGCFKVNSSFTELRTASLFEIIGNGIYRTNKNFSPRAILSFTSASSPSDNDFHDTPNPFYGKTGQNVPLKLDRGDSFLSYMTSRYHLKGLHDTGTESTDTHRTETSPSFSP